MIALLVGFIIGYLTTVPIGPINLAVMMKALQNKTGQGMMIGTGSAVMDVVYCAGAIFGISSLLTYPSLEFIFRVATFSVFFGYGVKTTFFKLHDPHLKPKEADDSQGFKRFFLLGMAMYFSNPSFLAYWITIAGIVHSYRIIDRTTIDNAMFALGTGVGVTTWFFTLIELVERHKMRFEPATIHKITRFFGLLMLIISFVLGYNLVTDLLH
ncbi:MAG: LysE family transporter [Bacteroidetes bacterium]|nr:LysE family transporter [Bacteroidota bacterium]